MEKISRGLASFEEVKNQIESILGIIYKIHLLLKHQNRNTTLRTDRRTSLEHPTSDENQLQLEYARLVYYSHIGINNQHYLPYVRNGKLFDWQEFNQQTEAKSVYELERDLVMYAAKDDVIKESGCFSFGCKLS